MEPAATETVIVISQRADVPIARENIKRVARVLELEVEVVQEEPRRLSTQLTLKLTGPPERIDDFRSAIGSGGFSSGVNSTPVDSVISGLLDDAIERIRRRRWRRRRAPKG